MKNGRLKIWLPGVLSVLLAFCSVGATVAGLLLCKANMNRKQGLPDIRDCVLDFTGYGTDNRYVKQHMFGTWEFFIINGSFRTAARPANRTRWSWCRTATARPN